jgi:hypothetical protein
LSCEISGYHGGECEVSVLFFAVRVRVFWPGALQRLPDYHEVPRLSGVGLKAAGQRGVKSFITTVLNILIHSKLQNNNRANTRITIGVKRYGQNERVISCWERVIRLDALIWIWLMAAMMY